MLLPLPEGLFGLVRLLTEHMLRGGRRGFKRATAPTTTCREWPEQVGWVLELCGVRYGGEGSACKGASLGVKQGLAGWRDHGLEFIGHSSVDGDGCLLLPSSGSGCVFFGARVR